MAVFVAYIIAAPTPCNTLNSRNNGIFGENIFRNAVRQKRKIPSFRMGLRPYISATVPNGIARAADTIRKIRTTHETADADTWYSVPICGMAIFMELPANGVVKFVIDATARVARRTDV